jgi:hypothetical protein
MSDEIDETESSVPEISDGAFRDTLILLAACADPKSFAIRVKELQRAQNAAGTARNALKLEREHADQQAAARAAELDARSAALRKREVAMAECEGMHARQSELLRQQRASLDARTGRVVQLGPGGLTRSFSSDEDAARADEPDSAPRDDSVDPGFELTVPSNVTLTRGQRGART